MNAIRTPEGSVWFPYNGQELDPIAMALVAEHVIALASLEHPGKRFIFTESTTENGDTDGYVLEETEPALSSSIHEGASSADTAPDTLVI